MADEVNEFLGVAGSGAKPEEMREPYPNLIRAGGVLITYGRVLKWLGFIWVIIGVWGAAEKNTPLLLAVGVIVGIAFHFAGVFAAAAGEAGKALADIAVNTAHASGAVADTPPSATSARQGDEA